MNRITSNPKGEARTARRAHLRLVPTFETPAPKRVHGSSPDWLLIVLVVASCLFAVALARVVLSPATTPVLHSAGNDD